MRSFTRHNHPDKQASEPEPTSAPATRLHPILQLQQALGNRAVQELLRNGGDPLTGALRQKLEGRLGTGLGDVRLHHGPEAQGAAASLGAPAFTVGQDIILGSAPVAGTPQGERLLAHEAAHTIQQSGAADTPGPLARTSPGSREEHQAEAAARGLEQPHSGAPLAIAAAPAAPLPFAPAKTFKDLWPEFTKARDASDIPKATALARELITAPYDFPDILNHGIDIVDWLQKNGEPALAGRFLDHVRDVWMIEFVSINGKLPARGSLVWGGASNDPSTLISLGKAAARAGKHDQAFHFFGVANLLLSFYAIDVTESRNTTLQKESEEDAQKPPALRGALTFPRTLARSSQYSDLRQIYDSMRDIYGFYSILEKEALAAGNSKEAANARTKSAELHKEIQEKFTWGGVQAPGGIGQDVLEPVEIAEVSYTDTPKGPGLTLHGANSAETDLTQLPGLPSPKEVGNNVQVQNLGTLQAALMAQTDFQAEIGREPEIRKKFGNDPVDLNDTKKRQQVWAIMYGVFKKAGPGALGSLMALIGRYLKAYTVHTTYNVRDWGKSYLDSDMPTDLAGRAEKDCGVYALTVAWDVYETVKNADPKLEVKFDLKAMLEHVTLVITDTSTGEFYVVNNDFVSPPQTGDPLEQVAPQYGAIRGLPYTVGPSMPVGLGSTKDPEKKFHDDAWTRYLAVVDWGLHLDIPPEVRRLEKTDPAAYSRQVLAIQEARYKKFYADQETLDAGLKELDPMVSSLAPLAADSTKLAAALTPVVDKAAALAVLFAVTGPSAGIDVGSARSKTLLPAQSEYLFTMEKGHTIHPLTRVALAILHLQAMGGAVSAKADALVKFCQKVPQFKQQIDAYLKTGAAGHF